MDKEAIDGYECDEKLKDFLKEKAIRNGNDIVILPSYLNTYKVDTDYDTPNIISLLKSKSDELKSRNLEVDQKRRVLIDIEENWTDETKTWDQVLARQGDRYSQLSEKIESQIESQIESLDIDDHKYLDKRMSLNAKLETVYKNCGTIFDLNEESVEDKEQLIDLVEKLTKERDSIQSEISSTMKQEESIDCLYKSIQIVNKVRDIFVGDNIKALILFNSSGVHWEGFLLNYTSDFDQKYQFFSTTFSNNSNKNVMEKCMLDQINLLRECNFQHDNEQVTYIQGADESSCGLVAAQNLLTNSGLDTFCIGFFDKKFNTSNIISRSKGLNKIICQIYDAHIQVEKLNIDEDDATVLDALIQSNVLKFLNTEYKDKVAQFASKLGKLDDDLKDTLGVLLDSDRDQDVDRSSTDLKNLPIITQIWERIEALQDIDRGVDYDISELLLDYSSFPEDSNFIKSFNYSYDNSNDHLDSSKAKVAHKTVQGVQNKTKYQTLPLRYITEFTFEQIEKILKQYASGCAFDCKEMKEIILYGDDKDEILKVLQGVSEEYFCIQCNDVVKNSTQYSDIEKCFGYHASSGNENDDSSFNFEEWHDNLSQESHQSRNSRDGNEQHEESARSSNSEEDNESHVNSDYSHESILSGDDIEYDG